MDEVLAEAKRRSIEVIAAPTGLSAAGGNQEGSNLRHPALHLLTGLKVWSSRVGEQSGLLSTS